MKKLKELLTDPKIKTTGIIIITIGMGIFFIRIAYGLWVKNNGLKTQIKKYKEIIAQAANIPALERSLRADIATLNSRIAASQETFFTNEENIFTSLSRYAQDEHLSLTHLNPAEKTKYAIPHRDDISIGLLPLAIKMNCDYHQLKAFLAQIEASKKNIIVSDIKIETNQQETWNHNIKIDLQIPLLYNTGAHE